MRPTVNGHERHALVVLFLKKCFLLIMEEVQKEGGKCTCVCVCTCVHVLCGGGGAGGVH